jgi:hypothetical protein
VESSRGLSEPKLPYPFPKESFLSVRLDYVTKRLLRIASKKLGKRMSSIVRASLWLTFILLDPDTTLRKILKPEAIERLCRGEDVVFADSLKPIEEFARVLVELALQLPTGEEEEEG